MANKGCNNCIHYKIGELQIWKKDIPSKCLLGNDEDFRLWWKVNGKKTDKDTITDMSCFKETKLAEFCSEATRILDEIQKVLDNN